MAKKRLVRTTVQEAYDKRMVVHYPRVRVRSVRWNVSNGIANATLHTRDGEVVKVKPDDPIWAMERAQVIA